MKTRKMKRRNTQKGGDLAYILGASAIGALILLGASQISRKKNKTNKLGKSYNGRIIENLYDVDGNYLPWNNRNNVVSKSRVKSTVKIIHDVPPKRSSRNSTKSRVNDRQTRASRAHTARIRSSVKNNP